APALAGPAAVPGVLLAPAGRGAAPDPGLVPAADPVPAMAVVPALVPAPAPALAPVPAPVPALALVPALVPVLVPVLVPGLATAAGLAGLARMTASPISAGRGEPRTAAGGDADLAGPPHCWARPVSPHRPGRTSADLRRDPADDGPPADRDGRPCRSAGPRRRGIPVRPQAAGRHGLGRRPQAPDGGRRQRHGR